MNEQTLPKLRWTRKSDTLLLALLAIALFLVAFIAHVVLGDYPKGIDVLPDEQRYLEIARSLFAGEGLIIRGEPSGFQKILYPISLFPALLPPDGADQIRIVGILNSFYACSTVFPAFAIARKLFHKPWVIAGCMVLAIIAPDLMYSMTFMSESVYMPLTLWLVYLCWQCFEADGKRQLVMSACAGLVCYLDYLCKEVAWMFLVAFVVVFIVAAVRKRVTVRQALLSLALFAVGFFVPFIVMKLTLFSGLSNSYSQFSFDILLAPYTVLFALYSIAVDSTYFIIGFGVFPVIFVACMYGELTRKERDLALFCLIAFLVGLVSVVFTISMREDVGHVALRPHLRYVAPLAIPLLYLFMKLGMRIKPEGVRARPARIAVLAASTGAFCMLVAAFFGTANLSQGFDYSQFHFMRWFLQYDEVLSQNYYSSWAQTISGITADDGELLVIAPLNWLCRFSVIVFAIVGTILLFNRNRNVRRATAIAITSIIAVFMVGNTVCFYWYNKNAYEVSVSDVAEICDISDQLAARSGSGRVIVVLDDTNTGPNNLIDTYLQDGAGNYEYIVIDSLKDSLAPAEQSSASIGDNLVSIAENLVSAEQGSVPTEQNLAPAGQDPAPNEQDLAPVGQDLAPTAQDLALLDSVDYILANTEQDLGGIVANAKIVGGRGEDGGNYYLYQL